MITPKIIHRMRAVSRLSTSLGTGGKICLGSIARYDVETGNESLEAVL